ncbi:Calx-beta domain-containing protein [Aliarcobacter butzleri]|uniref:Calx-beta domain-containing protein n=1 Tax=Aliarcobacter butzleri TaxID=28197 RepID=UPI00125EAB08|nr:Calx-beta domain-containing protein [Aliarcobacter butzleri]
MSQVGIIKTLSSGKFYLKDNSGNIKELNIGDTISENQIVYGDSSNSTSAKVEILLSSNDVIVLSNGQKQLIDSSLVKTAFGNEELFFTKENLDSTFDNHNSNSNIISNLRNAEFGADVEKILEESANGENQATGDVTEQETTEGKEEVEDQEEGNAEFQARDGNETDVNSDLRETKFPRTQSYREVENNDRLLREGSKELGSGISSNYFNPTTPSIIRPESGGVRENNPIPTTPSPTVVTPTLPKEQLPLVNLSVNDVIVYETDGFLIFTVSIDQVTTENISFNYKTSQNTATSGKDYIDVSSTITIPAGSTNIQIKVPVIDDYYSDNNETMKITISNPIGNVVIVKPEGIGTILDNPSANDKPLESDKPDSENGTYGKEDTVFAIITGSTVVNEGDKASYTVKLVDKDGNEVIVTKDTKVTVVYKNISTLNDDTEKNNNDEIEVIIKAGTSTSKPFIVQTNDDYLADNGEKYNLEIKDIETTGEFENIKIGDKDGKQKDVTTTILDNSVKDGIPTNPNENGKVEKNQEQVILKIVACDTNGNPLFEADKKTYKLLNETNEGEVAKYMVIAFKPNTINFTSDTKLPDNLQGGTVTIKTTDDTAKGVTTQTKEDGTQDYKSETAKTVIVGKVFEIKTLDDYISDNGEKYKVLINDNSYKHPITPIYENVAIDPNPVVTTILDNSVKDGTPTDPNYPNDPIYPHDTEENQDIVMIKLFAADKDGNVLKDPITGEYLDANRAEEGTNANYIAYAFKKGTTTFNDTTKLANQTGTVDIEFHDGTDIDKAEGNPTEDISDTSGKKDFNNTPQSNVQIGQAFNTKVFSDNRSEGEEKYTVTITANTYNGDYETVEIDTAPVTTTIFDEMVFVKIVPITEVTNEGGDLKYKVVLVNASGDEVTVPSDSTKDLKVYIDFDDNTLKPATKDIDYDTTGIPSDGTGKYITIVKGTSSTEFTVPTKDDYYAEGDEGLKITITGTDNDLSGPPFYKNVYKHTVAEGAPSDEIEVIGTIKDNPSKIDQPDTNTGEDNPTGGSYGQEDTVYAIITGTQTIKEGDLSTNYTIKLVDKDGNVVVPTKDTKITVTYNHYSTGGKPTQDDDTQYNNGDTIEVTILAGESEATFKVQTKDDVYKDNGEQFNLTITDVQNTGEFENVKIGDKDGNNKNVISTIEDNTTTGKETNVDPVSIVLVALEKGQTLADITDSDGKLIYKNTNTTPESGKLYYVAVAVDSDDKVLVQSGQVTVNTANGTAIGHTNPTKIDGSEDYKSLTNKSINIGEVFEVETNDDYVRDNDEIFTVKITNVVNTNYETPSIDTSKDTVTSTITDNPSKVKQPVTETEEDNPTTGNYGKEDTVYVKIVDNATVVEGEVLTHHVQLVDKDGNPVVIPDGETITVTLKYTTAHNIKNADFKTGSHKYDETTKTITVTIDKDTPKDVNGVYKLPIVNETIDDFKYEGDEVYTLTITDVEQSSNTFENIAIGNPSGGETSVTGTIKDGVTIYKDGAYIDPENAIVDEDRFDVTDSTVTIKNDVNQSDGTNSYQGQYLNIIKPNTDNNYTLSFDNTITVFKGDKDSEEDYGLLNLKSGGQDIHYQIIGNKIIGYVGTNVGNGTVAQGNKVFEITLDKNATLRTGANPDKLTQDKYTYTQFKNIDHPVKGELNSDGSNKSTLDDNITLEFGFKITDQGATSDVVKFKVTVNDSLPVAGTQEFTVDEDSTTKLIISPENFKDGKISIRVNGEVNYTELNKDDTKNITDPNDSTKVIGVITNNGDGTVTFKPADDYSNYADKAWFEYSVSDFDGDIAAGRVNIIVKPVADAPTIFVKDVTTYEDSSDNTEANGNKAEGTNKVNLELKVPLLSKDSEATKIATPTDYTSNNKDSIVPNDGYNDTPTPDQNENATGDKPERNGEITLTFTNGDKVTGAKIFKADGTTQVGADITTENQTLKVIIVDGSGNVDYTYHHKDIVKQDTPPAGTVYLTKTEYEALKIQHAEDNDTDIKITIGVTSYEVDDSGKPLNASDSTYIDKTNADLSKTTTAEMKVIIQPVTDEIELKFDNKTAISGNITTTTNTDDTFTFTNKITEGSGPIDLTSILSNTSGTKAGGTHQGTGGDLDGSEKREYTISDIPEGTVVRLIGNNGEIVEAIAGSDKKATLKFGDAHNKLEDPQFTMEFPKTFGGGVKATITLKVYDKGVDSTDTKGATLEKTVYLNLDVEPVATVPNINTIQVSQAIGYEDAGRINGNSATPNENIDQPANGIPLKIKVSSDDTDGSEKANVKIGDIPNGSALYVYDKSLNDGAGSWVLVDKDFASAGGITVTDQGGGKYTVEIKDYQNDKQPKYIPAHNDDTEQKLKVSVQFVDTVTYNDGTTKTEPSAWSAEKNIDVIVKNIADAPVGTEIAGISTGANEYTVTTPTTEDTVYNLKNIYTTPTILASSDSSEELTVRIELKDGFTLDKGTPYYIDNGEYVVKASDIIADKVKIKFPEHFSGDAEIKLTYVTTEKEGENDSKTWHTDKVNIFVNPIADDVNVAPSSTIYEDGKDKNGGALNTKINLTPTLKDIGTTNGTETVEGVKILASSVPAGYTLYSDVAMNTPLVASGGYYTLTQAQWENGIYAKNNVGHKIDSSPDFDLTIVYTVKDTNGSESDTKDFTHTHSVIVKAVTDQPTLTVNSITGTDVTIGGTNVTVNNDTTATFTVAVITSSPDDDSSEKVQEIVISGVPQGVSIENAEYMGYSGSVHNGIWVIRDTNLTDTIGSTGASQNIKFIVNPGADFETRPITITTYTQDKATDGTLVEEASQNITIIKNYTAGPGTGGTPQIFDLASKVATIYEDNDDKIASTTDDTYNLGKSISVTGNTGSGVAGGWAITITDFPEGTKVDGINGQSIFTYEQDGKTFYVITGSYSAGSSVGQNAADIEAALSNVIVTPPANKNSEQVGALKSDMTFTATISNHTNDGTYKEGQGIVNANPSLPGYTNPITPVTDEMTVAITAPSINEDGTSNITINLSNPKDGSKTVLVGSNLTIKITENWADDGSPSDNGTLTYNGTVITPNGAGEYTIPVPVGYVMGSDITGLSYKPANNRDGSVKVEVSVQNKEGNSITLTSKGEATINVAPVIDMKPEVTVVTATGIEDTPTTVGSTTLANAVKLNVSTTVSEDSSEKFTNIVLDKVPNGFTVWYMDSGTLKMATNIGQSGTGTFDLTPNITTDSEVHRNKWLIPVGSDGVLPEIYINAPENWAGTFDFDTQFTVKEQNLTSSEKTLITNIQGSIEAVADGVTIDPTLTFGKAFSWIDLKINANMKDVDGSETMSLELSGLGENAQFRYSDGNLISSATYLGGKWTIEDIAYDQINNIQLQNDKAVDSVGIKAWTVENDASRIPLTSTDAKSGEVNSTFKLDIKDVGGILSLEEKVNLDFNKLGNDFALKGVNIIDLSITGENKLENLSLDNVLRLTNDSGELTIKGLEEDKVQFKSEVGKTWSKNGTETIDSKTFDIYTNSGNSDVKVKVEQAISDGITN